jgi:hypothetical protein
MTGVPALMASLLYGAGLRLLECARLRTKDLDVERREIVVRDGTPRGERNRSRCCRSGWWIRGDTTSKGFATCMHATSLRRHHLHETVLQRAVREAVLAAGLSQRASCHPLRHSFATNLLEGEYDIRPIQQLLGHQDVSTTMITAHVLNRGGPGVRSPLDGALRGRRGAGAPDGRRGGKVYESTRAGPCTGGRDRQTRTKSFGDGSGLRIYRRSASLGRPVIGIGWSGRLGSVVRTKLE